MNIFEGLDVGGPASFRNDIYANGNLAVIGNLAVTGALTETGALTVGGALTVTGATALNGGLAATGTITFTGTWDGWIGSNETWTYVSATTFTVASDVTGKYQRGDKLKLTQTTAKYFYVATTPTFGAGVTTVTVTGGSDYSLANAAITLPFYSKDATPQGFPTWFNYTPTWTGFTAAVPTGTVKFSIYGRACTVYVGADTAGTSNSTGFSMSVPVTASGGTTYAAGTGLDNSAFRTTPCRAEIGNGATAVTFGLSASGGGTWTNSGTKFWLGQFTYTF